MEIVQEITSFEIVCHTVKFDKNVLALHWHDRCEICQVLDNNLQIIVEGKKISASAGDIIVINERAVHQFIIEGNYTLVRIWHLPMKLLLNFKSTVKPLKTHIKLNEMENIPELKSRLNALFEMMEREGLVSNDPFMQGIASAAYFLLERYFSESYNVFSEERDKREFYEVIEYINEHFKEDITVENIAKGLYLPRGRIVSTFKKYAGSAISEYINKLRIKNSNFLLSQGTSITEAALKSGFQSIRTFNNVYKGIMHMTPSEYIKNKK